MPASSARDVLTPALPRCDDRNAGGALCGVPLWLSVARRHGKKAAWLWAMAGGAATHALATATPLFLPSLPRASWVPVLLVCGFLIGTTSLCGAVVNRALMADVVDWDALHSGVRREGTFFAWFNFLAKARNATPNATHRPTRTYACFADRAAHTRRRKPLTVPTHPCMLSPRACLFLFWQGVRRGRERESERVTDRERERERETDTERDRIGCLVQECCS